jgi:hypothetical protein
MSAMGGFLPFEYAILMPRKSSKPAFGMMRGLQISPKSPAFEHRSDDTGEGP